MKAKTKRFLVVSALGLTAFACSESKNNISRDLAVLSLLSGSEQKLSEPTDLQRKAIEVGKEMGSSQISRDSKVANASSLEFKLEEIYESSNTMEKNEMKVRLFSIAEKNGEKERVTKLLDSPSEEFMKRLFELQYGSSSVSSGKNTRANGHWVCWTEWWGPVNLNNDFWFSSFLCSLVPNRGFWFQPVNHCVTSGWIWGCN